MKVIPKLVKTPAIPARENFTSRKKDEYDISMPIFDVNGNDRKVDIQYKIGGIAKVRLHFYICDKLD